MSVEVTIEKLQAIAEDSLRLAEIGAGQLKAIGWIGCHDDLLKDVERLRGDLARLKFPVIDVSADQSGEKPSVPWQS